MFTVAKELQLHHGAPVVHLAVLDKRCAPVRFGSDLGATRVPSGGGSSFQSGSGIPHSATMGAVSSSAAPSAAPVSADAPAAAPSTGATPGAAAVAVGTSAEAPAVVARTGSLTPGSPHAKPGRRQKSSTLGARLMGRIGRSATVAKAPHEGPMGGGVGGADAAATGGELTASGHSHLASADREHNLFVVSEEQMKLFRLPFLVPIAKARITAVEGSRLRHAAVTRFAARSGLLHFYIVFIRFRIVASVRMKYILDIYDNIHI